MNLDEFVRWSADTTLTERQAEALYRRHTGETRGEAAGAMDCSLSNVDNLERAARSKIIEANNLVTIAGAIDAIPDDHAASIGTCAECNQPTSTLNPDPDDDRPLEERRMLCPECAL